MDARGSATTVVRRVLPEEFDCGQALLGAGMLGVDGPEYDLWMTDDPMVSCSQIVPRSGMGEGLLQVSLGIQLAVGITPSPKTYPPCSGHHAQPGSSRHRSIPAFAHIATAPRFCACRCRLAYGWQ